MLKITAIGNLTNDVELKVSETTGKPYVLFGKLDDAFNFTLNEAVST